MKKLYLGILISITFANPVLVSSQAVPDQFQKSVTPRALGFIGTFISQSGSFAAPFAIIFAVLIIIFIMAIIIGGNILKKILRDEGLQIVLNDYWVSSDNNGKLLKSNDGMSLILNPIKRIPINMEKEKKSLTDLYKLTQKNLIEIRSLQKVINGFKWDILLCNGAETGIELYAYAAFSKGGIRTQLNLKQNNFDNLDIDYNSVFSFLKKK